MHRQSSKKSRFLSLFISLALFSTQVLWANKPEISFWEERRRARQPLQTAALPAPFHAPTSLPSPLQPTIKNDPLSSPLATVLNQIQKTHGRVDEIHLSKNPTVIHIQDVHLNAEAQRNMAHLLQHLSETGHVDLIGLEGAIGSFDYSSLRQNEFLQERRDLADYFLKHNRMEAASYFAITSETPLPSIYGVDDKDLYLSNVLAYKNALDEQEEQLASLQERKARLEKEKEKYYSSALLKFDRDVDAFRTNTLSLSDFILRLRQHEPQLPSVLATFLKASQLEKAINLPQIERERTHLIRGLVRSLPVSSLEQLKRLSWRFQSGHLSHHEFWSQVQSMSEGSGINFQSYPALKDYVHYLSLADSIDAADLFSDVKNVEKKIHTALARTKKEKQIISDSNQVYLSSKLVTFSLTSDEWKDYKVFRFSSPEGEDTGGGRPSDRIRGHLPTSWGEKDEFSSFENFYIAAEKRDTALITNLSEAINKQNANVAILVAGGFHAEGLKRQLQDQNWGYVRVTPTLSKVDTKEGAHYLGAFSREKTPLEKILSGEKLFLIPGLALPNNATVSMSSTENLWGIFKFVLNALRSPLGKTKSDKTVVSVNSTPSNEGLTLDINGQQLQTVHIQAVSPASGFALQTEAVASMALWLGQNPNGFLWKAIIGPFIERFATAGVGWLLFFASMISFGFIPAIFILWSYSVAAGGFYFSHLHRKKRTTSEFIGRTIAGAFLSILTFFPVLFGFLKDSNEVLAYINTASWLFPFFLAVLVHFMADFTDWAFSFVNNRNPRTSTLFILVIFLAFSAFLLLLPLKIFRDISRGKTNNKSRIVNPHDQTNIKPRLRNNAPPKFNPFLTRHTKALLKKKSWLPSPDRFLGKVIVGPVIEFLIYVGAPFAALFFLLHFSNALLGPMTMFPLIGILIAVGLIAYRFSTLQFAKDHDYGHPVEFGFTFLAGAAFVLLALVPVFLFSVDFSSGPAMVSSLLNLANAQWLLYSLLGHMGLNAFSHYFNRDPLSVKQKKIEEILAGPKDSVKANELLQLLDGIETLLSPELAKKVIAYLSATKEEAPLNASDVLEVIQRWEQGEFSDAQDGKPLLELKSKEGGIPSLYLIPFQGALWITLAAYHGHPDSIRLAKFIRDDLVLQLSSKPFGVIESAEQNLEFNRTTSYLHEHEIPILFSLFDDHNIPDDWTPGLDSRIVIEAIREKVPPEVFDEVLASAYLFHLANHHNFEWQEDIAKKPWLTRVFYRIGAWLYQRGPWGRSLLNRLERLSGLAPPEWAWTDPLAALDNPIDGTYQSLFHTTYIFEEELKSRIQPVLNRWRTMPLSEVRPLFQQRFNLLHATSNEKVRERMAKIRKDHPDKKIAIFYAGKAHVDHGLIADEELPDESFSEDQVDQLLNAATGKQRKGLAKWAWPLVIQAVLILIGISLWATTGEAGFVAMGIPFVPLDWDQSQLSELSTANDIARLRALLGEPEWNNAQWFEIYRIINENRIHLEETLTSEIFSHIMGDRFTTAPSEAMAYDLALLLFHIEITRAGEPTPEQQQQGIWGARVNNDETLLIMYHHGRVVIVNGVRHNSPVSGRFSDLLVRLAHYNPDDVAFFVEEVGGEFSPQRAWRPDPTNRHTEIAPIARFLDQYDRPLAYGTNLFSEIIYQELAREFPEEAEELWAISFLLHVIWSMPSGSTSATHFSSPEAAVTFRQAAVAYATHYQVPLVSSAWRASTVMREEWASLPTDELVTRINELVRRVYDRSDVINLRNLDRLIANTEAPTVLGVVGAAHLFEIEGNILADEVANAVRFVANLTDGDNWVETEPPLSQRQEALFTIEASPFFIRDPYSEMSHIVWRPAGNILMTFSQQVGSAGWTFNVLEPDRESPSQSIERSFAQFYAAVQQSDYPIPNHVRLALDEERKRYDDSPLTVIWLQKLFSRLSIDPRSFFARSLLAPLIETGLYLAPGVLMMSLGVAPLFVILFGLLISIGLFTLQHDNQSKGQLIYRLTAAMGLSLIAFGLDWGLILALVAHSGLNTAEKILSDLRSRSVSLNLDEVMANPFDSPLSKRQIQVIELSSPHRMKQIMENALEWRANEAEGEKRDVVFVLNPSADLSEQANFIYQSHSNDATLNGQVTFVEANGLKSLETILNDAHTQRRNQTGLDATRLVGGTGSVAVFRTSNQWNAMESNQLTIQGWTIPVSRIVTYMINLLEGTADRVPLHIKIKASQHAQQAA